MHPFILKTNQRLEKLMKFSDKFENFISQSRWTTTCKLRHFPKTLNFLLILNGYCRLNVLLHLLNLEKSPNQEAVLWEAEEEEGGEVGVDLEVEVEGEVGLKAAVEVGDSEAGVGVGEVLEEVAGGLKIEEVVGLEEEINKEVLVVQATFSLYHDPTEVLWQFTHFIVVWFFCVPMKVPIANEIFLKYCSFTLSLFCIRVVYISFSTSTP